MSWRGVRGVTRLLGALALGGLLTPPSSEIDAERKRRKKGKKRRPLPARAEAVRGRGVPGVLHGPGLPRDDLDRRSGV
jgi:hypothetical protein